MATVKFYLENKQHKYQTSINLIFTVDRYRRTKVRTDEKVNPKAWDPKRQRVKATHQGHILINRYLDDLENDVQSYYRINRDLDWSIIDKNVRAILRRVYVAGDNFMDSINEYITIAEQSKSELTVKKYKSLLGHLHGYQDEYRISLSFKSITLDFYYQFLQHLYNLPNIRYLKKKLVKVDDYWLLVDQEDIRNGQAVGLFDETVSKYVDEIKTFMKWANETGRTNNQEYLKFKTNRRENLDIITIDESELLQFYQAKLSSETLEKARDLYCLENFTGQRISNIKRFDISQLQGDEWVFQIHKGKRQFKKEIKLGLVGFMAPALEIIKRYDYKLPTYAEPVLNRNIKRAAAEAGLNAPVHIERFAGNKVIRIEGPKAQFMTTHTGRRSFINILLDKNVPPKTISDYTGQNIKTIMKYYTDKSNQRVMRGYLHEVGDITRSDKLDSA